MSKKELAPGHLRLNQLMVGMIDAVEEGDRDRLIKLSKHFVEDAEDFVGLLLETAGVSDEDLEKQVTDDEELIKDAASANQIKTASVK